MDSRTGQSSWTSEPETMQTRMEVSALTPARVHYFRFHEPLRSDSVACGSRFFVASTRRRRALEQLAPINPASIDLTMTQRSTS